MGGVASARRRSQDIGYAVTRLSDERIGRAVREFRPEDLDNASGVSDETCSTTNQRLAALVACWSFSRLALGVSNTSRSRPTNNAWVCQQARKAAHGSRRSAPACALAHPRPRCQVRPCLRCATGKRRQTTTEPAARRSPRQSQAARPAGRATARVPGCGVVLAANRQNFNCLGSLLLPEGHAARLCQLLAPAPLDQITLPVLSI